MEKERDKIKMITDEEVFNEKIEELKKLYKKEPMAVTYEIDSALKRIKESDNSDKNDIVKEIDLDVLGLVILAIFIAVIGLINPQSFMIYLFGFAFFLAGNLVGYNVDKVGLIFLFSHGVTGTCLMIASQIGKLFSSPIIGDLPRRQSAYLTINISMFVIALIMVVLCNLSKTLRKKDTWS
ncbi:MAG: hypothetical protein IKG14_00430 [Clostridia bacterium]|nr:hypothetical protein [Clostridia bacterium]